MAIVLVCGPPCAGKNTYVNQRIRPCDLVIDFDALMTALTGSNTHDHDDMVKPFIFAARDAIIQRYIAGNHTARTAWVIATAPRQDQRAMYRDLGASIVLLLPNRDTLHRRAQHERPAAWAGYIDNWLAEYEPDGTTPHNPPTHTRAPEQPTAARPRPRHPGLRT